MLDALEEETPIEGAAVVTPAVDVKAEVDAPKAESKNKAAKKVEDKAKAQKDDAKAKKDEPKTKIKPRVAGKTPDWNEPVEW